MNKIVLLGIFFIFFCLLNKQKSGYQNNVIPEFEPDDTQFMICQNNLKEGDKVKGQNNYHIKRNKISEPLEGTYSNFIDMFNIRKMDNFYYSPICEKSYPSRTNYGAVFERKVLLDNNQDYLEESELDDLGLNDPFYVYGNPKYIKNKITYDSERLENIFLNTRNHLVENEEDYHTRVKYQRYFIDYPDYP